MIIDTEDHVLTVLRARQMLNALCNFPNINDRTEIKFNYYLGSGWTISVVESDEPEEEPKPTPPYIQPGVTLTPAWTNNHPPFARGVEVK